jgi:diacylglycerol kinase (ATP)
MKSRNLFESFIHAVQGIIHCFKTERNIRIHFAVAIGVIIFSCFLGLSRLEIGLVIFAIGLVLISEMVNSIVETVLDIVKEEYDLRIKVVKDVTAGAVLVAVTLSVAIGLIVFLGYL